MSFVDKEEKPKGGLEKWRVLHPLVSENGPEGLKEGIWDEDGEDIGLRQIRSEDTVILGCRRQVLFGGAGLVGCKPSRGLWTARGIISPWDSCPSNAASPACPVTHLGSRRLLDDST